MVNLINNQGNLNSLFNDFSQQNSLKDLNATSLTLAKLSNIVTPLISKIFDSNTSINRLIDDLIQSTNNQLSTKGKIIIDGSKITFIPIKNESYDLYIKNFNNGVNKIKNRLSILNISINDFKKFQNILLGLITILQTKSLAEKIILKIKLKAVQAESSSPSPAKPLSGQITTTFFDNIDDRLRKLEGKPIISTPNKNTTNDILNILILLTAVLNNYLPNILNEYNLINDKIQQLQLIIGNTATIGQQDLSHLNIGLSPSTDITETYGPYIIKIEKLNDGSYQAVAYNQFSNLKIIQTAPSKFIKPDSLINELKQILII
jgi:hypothetical protein